MDVLTPDQLAAALESLGSGWSEQAGALHKRYAFDDFARAMAFANRVADAAEAADHHPDMLVGWGRVDSTGSTTAPAASPTATSRWPGARTSWPPQPEAWPRSSAAGSVSGAFSVTSTSTIRGPSTPLTSNRTPSVLTESPTFGARPSSPNT